MEALTPPPIRSLSCTCRHPIAAGPEVPGTGGPAPIDTAMVQQTRIPLKDAALPVDACFRSGRGVSISDCNRDRERSFGHFQIHDHGVWKG